MESRSKLDQPTRVDSVVSFILDRKIYALPLDVIVQIIPMVTIIPLPATHRAIAGIINFRGNAVPVIYLRRYFGMPDLRLGLHTPIVLVYIANRVVGLIVDSVIGVSQIYEENVTALDEIMPEGFGGIAVLKGVTQTPDGTILLLDLDELFSLNQSNALIDIFKNLPYFDSENEENEGSVALIPLLGEDLPPEGASRSNLVV